MYWERIRKFPGYSVCMNGDVRNDSTNRILIPQRNQRGIVNVGMVRDSKQHKRSVALLVAEAFLRPSALETFNTVIHLDGDLSNCSVDNLMWRPRWFAVRYHQQFRGLDNFHHPAIKSRIQDRKTGVIYKDSMDAATKCGLLDREILFACTRNTYVWPTYQEFIMMDQER
jgi:hypothetical protein